MTKEEFELCLDTEYTITLKGSMWGYILTMLSDMDRAMRDEMTEDIANANLVLESAANKVVGNALLGEIYNKLGSGFLARAVGIPAHVIEKLMNCTQAELDELQTNLRRSLN